MKQRRTVVPSSPSARRRGHRLGLHLGGALGAGAAALALSACAGTTDQPPELAGITSEHRDAQLATMPEVELGHGSLRLSPDAAPPAETTADDVRAAGGLWYAERLSDGAQLSADEACRELLSSSLICIGESHGDLLSHWLEQELVRQLGRRAQMEGRWLAVGFEMVERSRQPVLDRYQEGKLTEPELAEELEWPTAWGISFDFYRPTFEELRASRASALALAPPDVLVKKVAGLGVAGLEPSDASQLPELDEGVASHRAAFDAAMLAHPHRGDPARLYQAQLVRDEAMAEHAARWLTQSGSASVVVVVAGAGHCRDDAVPGRVRRRTKARTASVRLAPTAADGEGAPASAEGAPVSAEDRAQWTYQVHVVPGLGAAPEPAAR